MKQPIHFIALALAVASGATPPLTPPVAAAPYQSPNGYTIAPPSGWTRQKSSADVSFGNGKGARLAIVSIPLPTPTTITLEKVRDTSLASIQKSTPGGFKVLNRGQMTIGGERALTVNARYQAGKPPMKVRAFLIFVIHGGKIHSLTCTDAEARFPKTRKSFNLALASIRWTK